MKTKLITLLIAIVALLGSANAQKTVKVYKNGEVVYSEYITDIDSIKFEEQTAPLPNTENGHEYVDLGLPSGIKWATCNVGADTPEEYGDYFAWGETQPKSHYKLSTYKYHDSDKFSMTKYCTVDNKTVLELEDDAARVNWGGNWRMPTRAEQEELINTSNCTWTWTTQNGVNGYKVTSVKNGNSIFLPAAGYRDNEAHYNANSDGLYDAGSYGYYWSSSLYSSNSADDAYNLYFNWGGVNLIYFIRYYGYSVRAVCESSTPTPIVCTVSVSATEGGTAVASKSSVQEGGSVTLTATPNSGYVFKNWTLNGNVVSTQNPYTAIVTANSVYVANFEEFVPQYVDLGLSVKWATCNVGATTPEGYGDYFAWGETTPKSTYNWSTYKYCNGSSTTMTKYCTKSSDGKVDNKNTLELSDDAAHVNWGGNWRMPTRAEQDELRNSSNCTWTWTAQNGVNGYKVTSVKNGNFIFLPAAGYRNHDDLINAGDYGYYHSSSLNTFYTYSAFGLYFYSSGVDWYNGGRGAGVSVRAVCE